MPSRPYIQPSEPTGTLAEEALRQAQAQLRMITDTLAAGVSRCSREQRYLWVSPAYARWLGRSANEMAGCSIQEVVGASAYEVIRPHIEQVLTGQPVEYEAEVDYLGRAVAWVNAVYTPTFGATGVVDGWIAVVTDITQRKQAEEALRARTALLNLAHDAIVVRGTGDKITFWNQGAERTYGWTQEEALGQVTHDLLQTRFPKPLVELSAEVAGKGSWEGELSHTRKDGREIVVASRWAAQRDSAGRQAHVLEINRDITERKQAELELAVLRDQLAAELTAMNRLHELATRFLRQEDAQTLFEAILDAGIAILGAGKGFVQLLSPASGELTIAAQRGFDRTVVEFFSHIRAGTVACGTAIQTRQCVVVEDVTLSPLFLTEPRALQLELAAGVRAVVCAPLLTRADEVLGVLSVHFAAPHRPSDRDLRLLELLAVQAADFLERKGPEEAQARLAAIVEGSEDAILTKTLDGKIRTWNAGAERMFGYPAQEVIGQSVTLFIPPERADEEIRMLERLRRGESIAHYETVRVTKDGRKLDVSLTNSPVKDRQGRVVGASRIVRDIGELVRARQVLARSREDLECLVEERTAKLREALADLEHMSYSMIHDMRAPLRTMASFATLVEEQYAACLPPQGLDYFRRIREAASRLDRLVTGALNYNQVVRHDLAVTPVEIGRLLRGLIESYPNLQPSVADIIIEFNELVVLGNESLLTQCFGNLLGNAVKFVAPGVKPRIRVWAESLQRAQSRPTEASALGHATRNTPHESAPSTLNSQPSPLNPLVRLWIEDNGIGIPKEAHERIFALFQRMHREIEFAGTGIGLAIVRKASERMGGHVGLESEPGKGSAFWIELPKPGEAENRARLEDAA